MTNTTIVAAGAKFCLVFADLEVDPATAILETEDDGRQSLTFTFDPKVDQVEGVVSHLWYTLNLDPMECQGFGPDGKAVDVLAWDVERSKRIVLTAGKNKAFIQFLNFA